MKRKIIYAKKGITDLMTWFRRYCHAEGCDYTNNCPFHCGGKCEDKLDLSTSIAWSAANDLKGLINNVESFEIWSPDADVDDWQDLYEDTKFCYVVLLRLADVVERHSFDYKVLYNKILSALEFTFNIKDRVSKGLAEVKKKEEKNADEKGN